MKRFTQLYVELDRTTRTSEKLAALVRYFREAPPADAAWALYFLTGRRIKRAVNTRRLRDWVAEAAELPGWLIEECHHATGDLAEALALVLPEKDRLPEAATTRWLEATAACTASPQQTLLPLEPDDASQPPAGAVDTAPLPLVALTLHVVAEQFLVPLAALSPLAQHQRVYQLWRMFTAAERFVWHKLMLGEFRVGVAATLVARALAEVAGVSREAMAHRLMGDWSPTPADYVRLQSADAQKQNPAQPYPFFLAHPLEGPPDALGPRGEWQAEWKWDGIRAQLIRRQGQVLVWSRGEELITDRFPEIAAVGRSLADGTVLDGEILAWRNGDALPFATLQRRIGRKTVGEKLLADAPVVLMAFDLLELAGADLRARPLYERRRLLEGVVAAGPPDVPLVISPPIEAASWDELALRRGEARQRAAEGLMLKRLSSPYGVGRPRGDWWKWKVTPFAVDAVLIYAQPGNGRRASLFTDYTFGLWDDGELVPVAKAYSGLTDDEIRQVDAFVRGNTLATFGPVRAIRPELVFELHFEGVQLSKRHKSGVAVRFPRMHHWRRDKRATDADTLETLKQLARQAT